MKLTEQEKYLVLKCVEELSELSVELIHAVNKPKKNNQKNIHLEIKDVELYLNEIKNFLVTK